jgi:hypothetical protein
MAENMTEMIRAIVIVSNVVNHGLESADAIVRNTKFFIVRAIEQNAATYT